MGNYRIYGNSIQDTTNGNPSPTNPVEIQSVGKKIVNLYNAEELINNFKNNIIEGETYTTTSIQLKPNTNYYLKVFNPIVSAGYFYVHTLQQVNSTTSNAISLLDETNKQYPRGNEKLITTGDNGLLYFGHIYLDCSRNDILRNCKLMIIEGTYNKETVPIYVENIKYVIPVRVGAKNLLNPNTVNEKSVYIRRDNGKEQAISTAEWRASDYIHISGGKIYHFNVESANASSAGIAWYDANKTYISGENMTTVNKNNGNLIAPDNANYLRVSWRINGGYNTDWKNTLQLEEGTTETEYEPYRGEQLFNIYLDEPLRRVENYADYIDFKTGKVVRVIKEKVFDGNDKTWSRWAASVTENTMGVYYKNSEEIGSYGSPLFNSWGICTHFENGGSSHATANDKLVGKFSLVPNSNPPYFAFKVPYTELELWKEFLRGEYAKGTPLTVQYKLVTEDNTETIDLPELQTYEDYTKIEILTEVAPSKIEVEYQGYTLE